MRKIVSLVALLLLSTVPVYAQPVINPTIAEFTASVDHNVIDQGVPVLTNYELRVFPLNSDVLVRALNLNKPTPGANNTIISDITSLVAALPIGDYYGLVVAKGPGGETVSNASNPFLVSVRAPAAPTNLRIIRPEP